MKTLLPNLNATPVPPSGSAAARSNFQADPQPADHAVSFKQTLAKEVADRHANNHEHQVRNQQNTQNAQNAQNAQSAKDAQDTQSASDDDQDNTATASVDAPKEAKDTAKTKEPKDTAANDADKTSAELLALVAASQNQAQVQIPADSKTTAQASDAAATTALPVAAPVAAQADASVANVAADDGKQTAARATLKQSLPDAMDAKSKDVKAGDSNDAKEASAKASPDATATAALPVDTALTSAKGPVASSNKTADKDASGGRPQTDANGRPLLNTNPAATIVDNTANSPAQQLQLSATTAASNDNGIFNTPLQQLSITQVQAPAATAADKLAPSVGTTEWDHALGQKMVWMTNNGQQSATLTLNPRDLGPMQVVINVNKNQADATFIASNPEVKQALETAMPKLREMMDQAGIQLGQANVSTGMPNQQQQAFNQPQQSNRGHGGGNANGRGGNGGDDNIEAGAIAPAASNNQGLVDTFV